MNRFVSLMRANKQKLKIARYFMYNEGVREIIKNVKHRFEIQLVEFR